MGRIIYKIRRSVFDDSEIIQETESDKCNDPKFDINLPQGSSNWSLLMYAVCHGRKELVRYLLSFPNIDVNYRSNFNSISLNFCEDVSILRLLLSRRDLDVNIQNVWEHTGLHHACWMGRKACVREYLLDARVNVLIHNKNGKTALDIALINEDPDVAKIINNSRYTILLRIPNKTLIHDIVRMIIEEYV